MPGFNEGTGKAYDLSIEREEVKIIEAKRIHGQ
jgi:hypothetical protein